MLDYQVIISAEDLGLIAEEIRAADVVSLDTETTSLSPYDGDVRLMSLNTGKGVYVIDAFQTRTLEPIFEALRESEAVVCGQNLKFDVKFLMHKYGFEPKKVFDTFRASNIIYNGKGLKHDLWTLYSRELGIAPQTQDLGGSDWTGPLTPEQLDYAAEDVTHLPTLRRVLRAKLKEFHLERVAVIEFQAIVPEAAMELAGVPFDKERWTRLAEANKIAAEKLRKQLLWELPHPDRQVVLPGFEPDFNMDSPKQLLTSLQMLGLKAEIPGHGIGPIQDTSEMTLAMCSDSFPVVKKLLEYRGYAQAVKTFGLEYLANVSKITGRVHTNYYPYTGAGRYSSSGPNLQQLPRGKEFRECFRVDETQRLLVCDYSQVELRIAAQLSKDPKLIAVYARNEDAHSATAALITGKKPEDVSKNERQIAKSVNFGLIYGMAAPKLVRYAKANYGVTMTLAQAEMFRTKYFQGYAGIAAWHRQAFSDQNKRSGMVRTLAGRLRYLSPEMHSEWVNSPTQGTGADGLKTALRCVYERLRKYHGRVRMIHMVHDEIMLQGDNDDELLAAAQKDLEEGMIEGIQPLLVDVPVGADAHTGMSWADK